MPNPLTELHQLTRTLGEPPRDLVIIGEGNTSLRQDEHSFWIKASGQQMHNITEAGFVSVHFEPILGLLDNPPTTNTEMNEIIQSACTDPKARPSIEVSFHAMLLAECQTNCIAHTHPIAVNRIMCSSRAEQFALNRIFPDEVVLCGPQSVFVPYADPGLPLALEMRTAVRNYMAKFEEPPKVILLGNHGLITMGRTPTEALNITKMCVKAAEIFYGACTVGEPLFMSEADIWHIYRRPDEIYRQNLFAKRDET